MSTKTIEKELNGAVFVNDYDVDIDEGSNTYKVELNISPPADSSDMTAILNLKNKIRSVINSSYRIKFQINFLV